MKPLDALETKQRLEELGISVRSNELAQLAKEISAGVVRVRDGKLQRRGPGANRDLSNSGRLSDLQ